MSPCCPKKHNNSFFGGSNKITFRQPTSLRSLHQSHFGTWANSAPDKQSRILDGSERCLAFWQDEPFFNFLMTNVRRLFQTFLLVTNIHFIFSPISRASRRMLYNKESSPKLSPACRVLSTSQSTHAAHRHGNIHCMLRVWYPHQQP